MRSVVSPIAKASRLTSPLCGSYEPNPAHPWPVRPPLRFSRPNVAPACPHPAPSLLHLPLPSSYRLWEPVTRRDRVSNYTVSASTCEKPTCAQPDACTGSTYVHHRRLRPPLEPAHLTQNGGPDTEKETFAVAAGPPQWRPVPSPVLPPCTRPHLHPPCTHAAPTSLALAHRCAAPARPTFPHI